MRRLAALSLFPLCACATPAPPPVAEIRIVERLVEVPRWCTENPPSPAFSDGQSAIDAVPNDAEALRLIMLARPERAGYIVALETALKICRGE